MAHKLARMLFLFVPGVLVFGLTRGPAAPQASTAPTPSSPARTAYLLGDLDEEALIAFTTNLHASGDTGVPLLNGPRVGQGNRAFLTAYQPEQLLLVGPTVEKVPDLEQRLGQRVAERIPWKRGPPVALWKRWFPRAEQVVVCPAEPRRLLLQAACLAGALRAPLWISHGDDQAELARMLHDWKTRRVFAAGPLAALGRDLANVHIIQLPDEEAVENLARRHRQPAGPIATLVVANPADTRTDLSPMSVLAPYLALHHRGALLLTNDEGNNTAAVVRDALKHPRLREANYLLLAADLLAIPMERRPNPVPGKDPFIEMEPLTPAGAEPFSFATGRLFHDDPGLVLLLLARQKLLREQPAGASRRALVVSNPGDSLPLLETFSRVTARELRNAGYQTTALFGDDVNKHELRRQLPLHDVFLWEGHHNTLIKEYGFADWTEPLPPSFMFLQSCLALTDVKTHHLLERGSLAVVGSSTRIYSATGGAFSLAYFNALLHDGESLGGSLRQAKNFLVAYALLKDKRLGKDAKLTGANLRSAWAFTLWGDPTLQLPAPAAPADALPPVKHTVRNNTIVLTVPETAYDSLLTPKYQARLHPNTCLAGLLNKAAPAGPQRQLAPLLFAEVALPKAPLNQTPRLRGRLPTSQYVFNWDARRRVGYLLVLPRAKDQGELRFQVEYETPGMELELSSLSMPD
ncbi:MAG: hypothetical protein JNM56_20840 [Planctomycetia bacterium]|nr:hypothetical protein [Planctomycetia bacterium]